MIINCTKKLQDELGIKPSLMEVEDPLFSWHANILRVNRRKTMVLVNDASRYNIILYGLKAKNFKEIEKTITSAIYDTLLSDGVNPEIIEKYLEKAGQISFSKTQNRSMIGRLNKGCEAAEIFYIYYIENSIIQHSVSKYANRFVFIDYKESINHADEKFYQQLQDTFNIPAIKCTALKIKVKMNLEKFNVWREAIVPLYYSFTDLHNVIQKLFDWEDYHLHDFLVLDGNKSVVNIVCSEEDFEYENEVPMKLEANLKILEYFPKYKKVIYTYDFGDSWEHIIEVEDLIFGYDKNYACCLDGNGDAPPEDVGGEGGYEEFIKIINDSNHPDYEDMKQWSDSQGYKGFDIDIVNGDLKYL